MPFDCNRRHHRAINRTEHPPLHCNRQLDAGSGNRSQARSTRSPSLLAPAPGGQESRIRPSLIQQVGSSSSSLCDGMDKSIPHHSFLVGRNGNRRHHRAGKPARSILLHRRRELFIKGKNPFVAGSSDGFFPFLLSSLCGQSSSPPQADKLPGEHRPPLPSGNVRSAKDPFRRRLLRRDPLLLYRYPMQAIVVTTDG